MIQGVLTLTKGVRLGRFSCNSPCCGARLVRNVVDQVMKLRKRVCKMIEIAIECYGECDQHPPCAHMSGDDSYSIWCCHLCNVVMKLVLSWLRLAVLQSFL